jgi:hypothetical protein
VTVPKKGYRFVTNDDREPGGLLMAVKVVE